MKGRREEEVVEIESFPKEVELSTAMMDPLGSRAKVPFV